MTQPNQPHHPTSAMRSRCASRIKLAAAAAILCTAQAFAQFSASLQGTVKDASGALVASAAVTVTNVETGVNTNAATNESGQYRVNSLAPGRYRIHVTASGFQTQDVNANISNGQDAGVDVTLTIGSEQTVSVSTEAEGLNPEETRVRPRSTPSRCVIFPCSSAARWAWSTRLPA